MGLLDFLPKNKNNFTVRERDINGARGVSQVDPFAHWNYKPLFTVSYDGEKTPGEMGVIKRYIIDYQGLRARSWQSYLDSEITQLVINKYVLWAIGKGLRLQSEPEKIVLESEGISGVDNLQQLSKLIEARFKIYSKSKSSDHAHLENLHRKAKTAYINAIIGGDVLCLLRVKKGRLNLELIDGAHVQTPFLTKTEIQKAKDRGNQILNGIEISKSGEHIAYFVREDLSTFKRVPARGVRSGRLMAFMVYGSRYRLDTHRGLPLISAVMETLKKLERYKEAAVGTAEEIAKVVYTLEHKEFSTGENPLLKNMREGLGLTEAAKQNEHPDMGVVANKISTSSGKQVHNLPLGVAMKTLQSTNELIFKEFYTTNINIICAVVGIPPEVAQSLYNSNFSASRAALKDWEHTLNVNRNDFSFQYYQPFFDLWLDLEVLQNKIEVPGYLLAQRDKNLMVIDSYRNSRWVGANVPHIDPVKEVKAERAKLGSKGKDAPLTTVADSTEALGAGDFDQNVVKFADEVNTVEELLPTPDPVAEPEPNDGD